jgi:hypothetical protein
MMGRARSGSVVVVALFAMLAGGLVYRYWPSQEREIRRHLSNLAEVLSGSPTEGDPMAQTRFAVLREYFAPEARVTVDGLAYTPREAIVERLERRRLPPGGEGVEFLDVAVVLASDGLRARVSATARISTNTVPDSDSSVQTRRVTGEMANRDGDWVIVTAEAGPAY